MKSKRKASIRSIQQKKENHCPVPSGILVVIGGKENNGEEHPDNKKRPGDFVRLEVLKAFKEQTHKRDPRIEVITSSSSEGAASFQDYQKALAHIELNNIGHIHHEKRSEIIEDPMIERIKAADAFFLSGGDQLKLTSLYGGTDFLLALKERYIHDNLVIAGTSAGAMALSTPMIYAGNEEVQELGGEIKVTTGLEFMKDVCIDTHFVHRGRFVRMAQVVVTNPTCIGIGIEEDTAIIVKNGTEVEVTGTGLVIVVEGHRISFSNMEDFTKDKPVTIRDLNVHLLSSGDKYEIRQRNPQHK